MEAYILSRQQAGLSKFVGMALDRFDNYRQKIKKIYSSLGSQHGFQCLILGSPM